MKYIRYWCDIGYQTDDDYCVEAHPDDINEYLIRLNSEMFFYRHCENYAYLFMADFDENGEEDYDTVYNDYVNNQCSYGYEEISEEEYMQAKAEGY